VQDSGRLRVKLAERRGARATWTVLRLEGAFEYRRERLATDSGSLLQGDLAPRRLASSGGIPRIKDTIPLDCHDRVGRIVKLHPNADAVGGTSDTAERGEDTSRS